ncbi:hypothetical protein QYE76_048470 [Lolium multiflorum]|uniref:RNase H type-1 domain-containing protein n=1 Tax=Lolium multiflorum TaxID=4521 RepID=A0AAD8WFX5_LOLMU|nr:hypothetical protein QYE76_048470 [Lolium multiflorum]
MPCLAHLDPATGSPLTPTATQVGQRPKERPEAGYKRARKHRPRGKGGKGKNKDKEEDSSEAMDEDDNSPDPKAGSAVCRWSEVPCTFDREDHPAIVPKEYYALVVSPRIDGYDFSKCLMDGGASLNIMYLETLERMNLTKEQLKHSNTEFHGVVPGKKANSLGSITLPVADVHNFREEKITFEVVPFKSSYHVIFGSPPTTSSTQERAISTTSSRFRVLMESALVEFLRANMDIFAWQPSDMSGVPRELAEHYLNINPGLNRCHLPTYDAAMPKDQIGRNVHAYVDDIAFMTRKDPTRSPTSETFDNLQIHFEATNNMAEYEALLHGLRIAKEIGIKHIICCGDSDLVAQQVAGTWNARNSVMAAYRDEVDEIAKCFLEVKYVRRDDNTAADMLSKLGSGRKPIPPGIFLEHLRIPSVKGANPENPEVAVSPTREVLATIPAWTQPFLDYLIDQKLPEDEVLARQIIDEQDPTQLLMDSSTNEAQQGVSQMRLQSRWH